MKSVAKDERISVAVEKAEIGKMVEMSGVGDPSLAILALARIGLRQLQRIESMPLAAESQYAARQENDGMEILAGDMPFTKDKVWAMFSKFNVQGVTPITPSELDDFWDYLVMNGFKNSLGHRVNLSNVGRLLKNWRSFNKPSSRQDSSSQETEEDHFRHVRRMLVDAVED